MAKVFRMDIPFLFIPLFSFGALIWWSFGFHCTCIFKLINNVNQHKNIHLWASYKTGLVPCRTQHLVYCRTYHLVSCRTYHLVSCRTYRLVSLTSISVAAIMFFSLSMMSRSLFSSSTLLHKTINLLFLRLARPRICIRAVTVVGGYILITWSHSGQSTPSSATDVAIITCKRIHFFSVDHWCFLVKKMLYSWKNNWAASNI